MKKPLLLVGLIIILAVALLTLLLWEPQIEEHENLASVIAEVPEGGDFTLNSYAGEVSLRSLHGKVVVLYFGYTWCPDICPTSLGFLAAALNELSAEELADLQVLFISVDPARDTLVRLKEYGEYFHSNILGITGSPEEVVKTAKLYGAAYSVAEQDSAAGYVVDHTADLYMINRQGRLETKLPHGTSPNETLVVLRKLLAN
ncbi:MAG: SCO family protein [Sedimenticola sp.]